MSNLILNVRAIRRERTLISTDERQGRSAESPSRTLTAQGYTVVAYNRTVAKVDRFLENEAKGASDGRARR